MKPGKSILILVLFHLYMRQGICLCSNAQRVVINVCVDLGRVQMLMPEHLLHGFDVPAVLQHERCRRVAQLVR